MAHTPGPWRAVSTEIVSTACPDDDCVVADVLSEDYVADARLIAAAPELLEACRNAVHALNTTPRFRCGKFNSYDIASMCDAAIAKAEGRTDEE